MSNTYVKKYDVGQINLDLPYANYIHELPLLSFGDVQHTINLSLVFNYARKAEGDNSFNIANGFKLNMQKKIIINGNDTPIKFYDSNGKTVQLTQFGDVFTFDDDSQRILRRTQLLNMPSVPGSDITEESGTIQYTYTVEYPDFSREDYDSDGKIIASYDKYSTSSPVTYAYNEDDRLESITYGTTKIIEFAYLSNKLHSITYAGKITTLDYDDNLLTVTHYSEVDYHFTTSYNSFEVYSTNTGEEYSEICSRKWICSSNDNSLTVNQIVGSATIDTTTYNFWDYSETTKECNFVIVTDKFGVTSRIQLENRKPVYSYELTDNFFNGEEMGDPIYSGTVFSYNEKDAMGPQSPSAGSSLTKATDSHWTYGSNSTERISGRLILSGWINVAGHDNCTFTIKKPGIPDQEYCVTHSVPIIKNQTWQYFSFGFNVNNMNGITVTTNITNPSIYSKDFKLTFKSGTILSNSFLYSYSTEDVFIQEDSYGRNVKVLAADKCKFYIGNTLLNQKVTSADVLRYKINQRYDRHSNEIYYNDCKGISINSNDFNLRYDEGGATYTVLVTNLAVGTKVYKNGKEYTTKTNFYTVDDSTHLMSKSFMGDVDDVYYKEDVYDDNLDLIRSTVDGITTTYSRNSKGLVTSQVMSAEGTTETISRSVTYDDSITKIESETDEFGVTTTYQTDDAWGLVTKVIVDENNTVTDEYDLNKLALTKKLFSSNENSRNNTFNYSNGKLSSIVGDALNYTFGYTPKDEIESVTKGGLTIANYVYDESANGKNITNNQISHTETQKFDKHGRLTEIVGVLTNTYDTSPIYDDENNVYLTAGVDDITGKLAVTNDRITNKQTKYAYKNGHLSKKGVFYSENKQSEENFTYDGADRLISDHYVYNSAANNSVTSEIEYCTGADSPLADNRILKYTYKVNNYRKAQTSNTYDAYKRLTNREYKVNKEYFVKDIEYDKTRPSRIVDTKKSLAGNTTLSDIKYEYDALGRISKERDSNNNILKSYTYDAYGQLTQENNQVLDKTFQYVYNTNTGNLDKVIVDGVESAFVYDSAHPDRLTRCGAKNIQYNSAGLPIAYGNKYLDWTNGKLAKYYEEEDPSGFDSSESTEFSYNAFGQRVRKEYSYYPGVDYSGDFPIGKEVNYDYDHSGRLIREISTEYFTESASETVELIFLYDESGMVGFMHSRDGSTPQAYYYQRNLQGDVVAIYDTSGVKVANYTYDAWGNCTASGSMARINPIRYRGYYWDSETNWYYLNSRYYSPEFRRFISPDDTNYLDPETPNGLNLYCYCGNDPVNYCDPSGHLPQWAWKLIIGTAFIFVGALVTAVTAGTGTAFWAAFGSALLTSTIQVGISTAVSAGFGFIGGGLSTGTLEGAFTGMIEGAVDGYMWGGIISGGSQILSGLMKAGSGISAGRVDALYKSDNSTTLFNYNNAAGKSRFRIDVATGKVRYRGNKPGFLSGKELNGLHYHFGKSKSLRETHRFFTPGIINGFVAFGLGCFF